VPSAAGCSGVQAQLRGGAGSQQWYGKPAVRYARVSAVSHVYAAIYARVRAREKRRRSHPSGRAGELFHITVSASRVNASNWREFSRDLKTDAPLPVRPLVSAYLTSLRLYRTVADS
jgi:hypothetical protein